MEIREQHEHGTTIAILSGKLDAESSGVFNDWFHDRIAAGDKRFILNFGGISYLSSAGLRAVLALKRTLDNNNGHLVVCGLYGVARQVFQVAGLLKVMQICPDVTESLVAIQNGAE